VREADSFGGHGWGTGAMPAVKERPADDGTDAVLLYRRRGLCEGTRGLTEATHKGLQGRRASANSDSLRGLTGAAGAGSQGRQSAARTRGTLTRIAC